MLLFLDANFDITYVNLYGGKPFLLYKGDVTRFTVPVTNDIRVTKTERGGITIFLRWENENEWADVGTVKPQPGREISPTAYPTMIKVWLEGLLHDQENKVDDAKLRLDDLAKVKHILEQIQSTLEAEAVKND